MLDQLAYALAHGLFALDVDYIRTINYAIDDRIGYRALTEFGMSAGRRELRADEQKEHGQVQRDIEIGGDGGEPEQHRLLVRVRAVDRLRRAARGEGAPAVVAAA